MATSDYRVRDLRYTAGDTFRPHAHDEVQVSIVLRGTYCEDAAGALHRGAPADVVVKPAGTLHANEFHGTRIICVDGPPIGSARYAWHRGDEATTAGFRLVRRFLAGLPFDDEVDELLAAIEPRPSVDRSVAKRAAAALDDLFATRVDLRSVARELHVHPVYLARVFRAQWGCTPREYLQRARVRAAAYEVTSSREPLAQIALSSGFADQAHMTRVFARVTGVTPAVMRELARR